MVAFLNPFLHIVGDDNRSGTVPTASKVVASADTHRSTRHATLTVARARATHGTAMVDLQRLTNTGAVKHVAACRQLDPRVFD